MFCSICGKSNAQSSKFCSGCGSILLQIDKANSAVQGNQSHFQLSDNPASTDTETSRNINPEGFYKAIIGSKNQKYYLDRFSRFDNEKKISPSWNWSAFFVTAYWLLYRKMWLNALIYFLSPYIAIIIALIIGEIIGDPEGVVIAIGYILYLAIVFIIPPMYANAIYYRHCKKKIAEADCLSIDKHKKLAHLSAKGGVSKVVMILWCILATVFITGVLAAIAIPTYDDYSKRIQEPLQSALPEFLVLPDAEAAKVTGSADIQYNTSFTGSIYNGSNYFISHLTVGIIAKEKNGQIRWQKNYASDVAISALTTGTIQVVMDSTENADIEWSILEIKGKPP